MALLALASLQADTEKVQEVQEFKGQCQPVFLFFKDGKVIDKVVGVQAPLLERKIAEYSAIVR